MSVETNKTAGDDIDSRCLKCKAVTNHTIIAISGDTIAKVECNTCRARHNYRAPKAEKKKASSTRRRRDGAEIVSAKAKKSAAPRKKVSRGAVNFDALIDGKDVNAAIAYSMEAVLAPNDLVNHSIFGLGIVRSVTPPNKAEITFREHGSKILICAFG